MAVRTRAQLLADFADNTAGNITESRLRALVDSLVVRGEAGSNRPDAIPYTPTLFGGVNYDKEFSTMAALDGTELGSPATPTALVDGALRIVGGTSTGFDIKGREWPVPPSAAFKLTVKMRRKMMISTYHIAQTMVRAGTSGAGTMAGIGNYQAAGGLFDSHMASNVMSSLTARTSVRNDNYSTNGRQSHYYHRIVYDGTNLSYYISLTGFEDDFSLFYGPEVAATVLGAAPGRFVLVIDTVGTTAGRCFFEWARFTT